MRFINLFGNFVVVVHDAVGVLILQANLHDLDVLEAIQLPLIDAILEHFPLLYGHLALDLRSHISNGFQSILPQLFFALHVVHGAQVDEVLLLTQIRHRIFFADGLANRFELASSLLVYYGVRLA